MKYPSFLLLLLCAALSLGCNESDLQDFQSIFADTESQPIEPSLEPCPDGRCPVQQSFGQETRSSGSPSDVMVDEAAAKEVKGDGGCPNCRRVTGPTTVWPSVPSPIAAPRPMPLPTRVNRPAVYSVSSNRSPGFNLAPGEVLLSVGPLRPLSTNRYTVSPPSRLLMPPVSQPTPQITVDRCPDGSCDTPREGAFRCARCGQPTVGRDWHQVWADDGTPLTCLCESCWRQLDPKAREFYMRSYAAKSGIRLEFRPVVSDSIRHAASQTVSAEEQRFALPTYGQEFSK
ncbi:MAG: hypothetical protein AAF958_00845 [Planctomycetota bacterium]